MSSHSQPVVNMDKSLKSDAYMSYILLPLHKLQSQFIENFLISWCRTEQSEPGPHFNKKTVFPRHGDSHVKDKTVARPSHL